MKNPYRPGVIRLIAYSGSMLLKNPPDPPKYCAPIRSNPPVETPK
jgi:hypothetical protein